MRDRGNGPAVEYSSGDRRARAASSGGGSGCWRRAGDGDPPVTCSDGVRRVGGRGEAAMPPVVATRAGGDIDGRSLAGAARGHTLRRRQAGDRAKRGVPGIDNGAGCGCRRPCAGVWSISPSHLAALTDGERGERRRQEKHIRAVRCSPTPLVVTYTICCGGVIAVSLFVVLAAQLDPGIGEEEISAIHFIIYPRRLFGKNLKSVRRDFHRYASMGYCTRGYVLRLYHAAGLRRAARHRKTHCER